MRYQILPLLLLAGCASLTTPRTTTDEERAWANLLVGKVSVAIAALQATGNIDPERAQLALDQLQDIREAVEQSAESPISWTTIMDRLTTIALEWAVPVPKVSK